MTQKLIEVGHGFWNIRGSYRIAGVIDVGTQASLVRKRSGNFVLLDTCLLTDATVQQINALTDNGRALEAILNVHPFHTLHIAAVHKQFPKAKLYGTARHHAKQTVLPWEAELTESPALHALYQDDLEFSTPAGVDFISDNEDVHFSSVLVWHQTSKTIHVDDTLMYIRMPLPVRLLGKTDTVRFHPTLASALQKRPGAVDEFRVWAAALSKRWHAAENLCAAHTASLLGSQNTGDAIAVRIDKALQKVSTTLAVHERRLT